MEESWPTSGLPGGSTAEKLEDVVVLAWGKILRLRCPLTEGHSARTALFAVRLGAQCGLTEEDLRDLWRGAILHDIGKMAIPDRVLLKDGPLDPYEQAEMRAHTVLGHEVLEPIDFLRPAVCVPLSHHERWDGNGYPHGLAGQQIPLFARIFAVADVYDALTSDRTYRTAWSCSRAAHYIQTHSASHFDPTVVEAFKCVVRQGNEPQAAPY